MLPVILAHARYAFRLLTPEAKAEAVQEVICNALSAFVRLVELHKTELAYPTVLALYGIRQTRDHRKVGSKLNVRDVMSPHCQAKKGIVVERLDQYDKDEECWREILVADRTCTPAELAASRIDVPAWLATLTPRDRKIAMQLGSGENTGTAAKKFNMSAGRVSQRRREMAQSWSEFIGDAEGHAR